MRGSIHGRRALVRGGALAFLLAVLGAACARGHASAVALPVHGAPGARSASEYRLPPGAEQVRTAVIHAEPVPDAVDLAASIQADPARVVRVYAPVSGRVLDVAVRPSDDVREGQALAEVASSDVAGARASYEQAEADAQLKQQTLTRLADPYAHHAIALKDYQQAQADARIAAAALASAREHLALIGASPAGASDRIVVRAPRAGVVIDLGATNGEFSKSLDNATPLCTIADLSVVWAVGEVFEQDLARVARGSVAQLAVSAYPGEAWQGRVSAISSVVDPTTRTASIRVVLRNPGLRLKPNMFGRLRVAGPVRIGLVVPQTAVLREGANVYLFVEKAPGVFERRTVTLGRDLDANQVEIAAGLSSGDTVVVEGANLLQAAGTAS